MALNELITPYQPLNLIKAGAGAGKTYHIQKTLTDWICQGNVKADRILAVTFTNAAANEMQERIRLALIQKGLHEESKLLQQSSISTIHGFGLSLIERFAFEKGSSPEPKQLTEAEQRILISRALSDVEDIDPILSRLPYWDYKLKKGKDFISASEQLKNDLLATISSLLNLGGKIHSNNFNGLVEQALESVRITYGKGLSKESTLNDSLMKAVQVIQNKYTFEELIDEWGSNTATRSFVTTIFDVTPDNIKDDWKLWTKLQSIETAPKIFNKKTGDSKHEDSSLAFALWAAADKLKVHPGPLNKSLAKIAMLLNSAKLALGEYQAGKNSSGLIDFNDMVTLSEKLMKEEQYLSEMKYQYDCLIIDEFQDTNPLQFALLWAFQKVGIPTLIVGDVKQSIMGFQGADKRLFESLLKQNPDCSRELTSNWRSTNEVMEFVNKLGPKLFKEQYQKLTPRAQIASELDPVVVINFSPELWGSKASKNKRGYSSEGAFAIVPEIKVLLDSDKEITDKVTGLKRKIRPNDIAVLGKTHNDLNRFAFALRQAGIQPQIKRSGWFESDSIKELFYALSYIADPRDQHALLYLKVLRDPSVHLQDVFSEYLKQDKPRRFEFIEVEVLNELSRQSKFSSIKHLVQRCIDDLGLWDKFAAINESQSNQQQRTNLLKLIHLVGVFEKSEYSSLKAQGIYGKGLSSFLIWLKVNRDDFGKQPDVNGDNQNAVVLSTWYASKGLEWPIVIVLGLEKEVNVRLPHISVQYNSDNDVDEMLENAFTQIVTSFDDSETKQKFIDMLMPFEQETLKNLTYVVMTRAREQLILPWFETDKPNTMQSYVNRINLDKYSHKAAHYSDELNKKIANKEPTKQLGRINLTAQKTPECVQANISPTSLANNIIQNGLVDNISELVSLEYGLPVNLGCLDNYQANDVGTWIHQCYQVLITRPEIRERLFVKLPVINGNQELKEQLIVQVDNLKTWLNKNWSASSYRTELPMLSIVENGATLSGILDLLVETNDGYWIVDHKTDCKTDDKQFKHHLPQLLTYAKHITLNKPIIGVAINWVREGRLTTARVV
ncbi:UvrD-helicase domain-containing protein [Colwellia piezophila]|uniref:UvrD-helicase domain-containing protein n=1 Tax=Colwellia piezophila TaxID=211668 RepID=UPI00036B79E2|nr:UvrD-helicase domain-containing protein [Colwellia piezophila]